MHGEDRGASRLVGQVHDDAAVEAAGPQQRLVEHLGLVRGRQHDDAAAARETIHLGQDLVQRLFLLIRATERKLAARAADRVELVDEDDSGRMLARLLEKIPHARGADAYDHLHELRGAHREERHAGLAGDRFGEQRLAGAGRANEQHAFRRRAPQACIAVGLFEEIDDLDELVLGFIDAGNVVERNPRVAFLVVASRLAAPHAHQAAYSAHSALPRGAAVDPHIEADQEQCRTEAEQQRRERAAPGADRDRADLNSVVDQERLETGIDERRHGRRECRRRARLARLGARARGRPFAYPAAGRSPPWRTGLRPSRLARRSPRRCQQRLAP